MPHMPGVKQIFIYLAAAKRKHSIKSGLSHEYDSVRVSFRGVAEAVPVILSRLHLHCFHATWVWLCLNAYLETFPVGSLSDQENS